MLETETLPAAIISTPPDVHMKTDHQRIPPLHTPAGKFAPGHKAIGGRPVGRYDFWGEMIRGLRKVEREKGKGLIEHAWERAFLSDAVLVAMLKKILPDLTSETGSKGPSTVNIVLSYRGSEQYLENTTPSLPQDQRSSLPPSSSTPLSPTTQYRAEVLDAMGYTSPQSSTLPPTPIEEAPSIPEGGRGGTPEITRKRGLSECGTPVPVDMNSQIGSIIDSPNNAETELMGDPKNPSLQVTNLTYPLQRQAKGARKSYGEVVDE